MTVLNKILSALPGNGYKTVIGAAAIILSYLIAMLTDVMPVFPDAPQLDMVLEYSEQGLGWVKWAAELFGVTYTTIGLAHKPIKKADPQDPARSWIG